MSRWAFVFGAVGILVAAVAPETRAGNNGWSTAYNSDVEWGEKELMLMNDITSPSKLRREDDGFGDYASHMIELEYGATRQLAAEFMIEWFEDFDSGDAKFTGFRLEARYRLFEGHIPLNPMVYVEYEDLAPETRYKMEVSGWVRPPYPEADEGEAGRERIFETRLILSEDIGPVNVAFNWINETDLRGGVTAFGYAVGVMWMAPSPLLPSGVGASCRDRSGGAGGASRHDRGGCACEAEMPGCRCAHCGGGLPSCTCAHGGMAGLGFELWGALGDTRVFELRPSLQEHYLGPIVALHLTPHWMVHAQLGIGLSEASDELVRVNIAYEF